MKEIWKDIKDYEGLYQVSNLGRVRSLTRSINTCNNSKRKTKGRILKYNTRNGYYQVNLCKNGTRKAMQIHRLVAGAFIPNPSQHPFVNHKDFVRTNNSVDNLEWCTQLYNVNYSLKNMCHPKSTVYSSTGEKYIYFRKGKSKIKYRVCYNKCDKSFDTLQEAIAYRDYLTNYLP